MPIEVATDLDYLIPELRWRLGDIDSTAYRYPDSWLRVALVASLKSLQRWWGIKYVIDETTYIVSRHSGTVFANAEPPVIQQQDEIIIVLMAAIVIKDGSLESASWSAGSWKDAEISVSNIESGRLKESSLTRMWNELLWYIQPPTKRLIGIYRSSIPGAEEYND